ncbi:hypothetical protein BDC45DRAFT_511018 [Circinella umbellata]|nr:hypothetical protein BDC45DRAFT_511018 [Circinella umbellata]
MMLQQENSATIPNLHQRDLDSNSRTLIPLEDIADLLKIPVTELPKHARVDKWLRYLDRREKTTGEALITESQKRTIQEYGKVQGKTVFLDPNEFIELLEKLISPLDRSSFITRDGEEEEEEEEDDDYEDEEEDDLKDYNEMMVDPRLIAQRQRVTIDHQDENYDNMRPYQQDPFQYNKNHDDNEKNLYTQQKQQRQQRDMFKSDVLDDTTTDPVISHLMDARQRTSKMLNFTPPRFKMRRLGQTEESDNESGGTRGGSPNHPSVSPVSNMSIQDDYDHRNIKTQSKLYKKSSSRPSPPSPSPPQFHDHNMGIEIRPMISVSESLHSQHSSLAQQQRLQEAERRLDKVSQEYDEQIAKLEIDLSSMRHEIVMHKKTISEFQAQENNRMEHITALEKQLEDSGDKTTKLRQSTEELKDELEEKNEELERLQDTLQKAMNKLKYVENNFDQLYQEYNAQKAAQETITELQLRLDQEIEGSQSLIVELEDKQKENKRMKHIIDDMKTDLDEARRRAAQIVVPVKSLGDELGESSSILLDTKEVQTEQFEQAHLLSINLRDQEKLESLGIVLTKTEEQLEETEGRLEFSEQRADELEGKLIKMEQDLKKVKRRRDELQEENTDILHEMRILEANLKRHMDTKDPISKKNVNTIGVQSDISELCDTCGYIAAEHEDAIYDLTQRVQDQAETIRRVRNINTRKNDSTVTEYISMAHHTLFHKTTKTARTWRILLFLFFIYTMIQSFVFIQNMFAKVSYGVEDYPYVTLYPLPVGPYTSRNKFIDELIFWLQNVLLDAEDYAVAQ